MICPTKIIADIVNGCTSPVRGIEPRALWAYRRDINMIYSGNEITGVETFVLGVIESTKYGLNAGHTAVVMDEHPTGYAHRFTGIVQTAVRELDELDDVVVFVKSNSGVWSCLGAFNGLYKATQTRMANDALGTVSFELTSREGQEEMYEEYPLSSLAVSQLLALPTTETYEVISGLRVNGGDAVSIYVGAGVDAYYVDPEGDITMFTGTLSISEPLHGYIKIAVPKGGQLNLTGSDVRGNVISKTIGYINIGSTANVLGVYSENLENFNANSSSIEPDGEFGLNNLLVRISQGSINNGIVTATTPISGFNYSDLSADAKDAIAALVLRGWTITLDGYPI